MGFMKYAVEMSSGTMICNKDWLRHWKVDKRGFTERQTAFHKPISIFQSKENRRKRLKTEYEE
jgi:hypothetical protein